MKQGNPTKRFGIIALIGAMLQSIVEKPEGVTESDLIYRRNMLLTNNGKAPIPSKFLNQKQKRKIKRQTNNY